MNCKTCNQQIEITPEEKTLYQKFKAVPQQVCFECNQKEHLCFRNERILYNRKCDGTGENIVSIYSPDKPYKVYKSDYWYGDKWDPVDYGQNIDFNRPFFEQLKEVDLKVPHIALINIKYENSDYCNCAYANKNCYLIFGGDFNQDCMYGTLSMHNRDSLDLNYSNNNELSYMLGDSFNCYKSQFVFDSKNCNNCAFLSDCIGCNDCILCVNLVNKSYCINNVQYSKEEYEEKKQQLLCGSYIQQQKNWNDFLQIRKNRKTKYAHAISCEHCSGDYLTNCKNCRNCFDASDSQDLKNVIFANNTKDCFNCSLLGDKTELCYDTISTANVQNIKHSFFIIDSFDVEYSKDIIGCHNVFGCVSLYRKEYCILNKKYSKTEYEKLRDRLIDHMKKTGEWEKFLPKDLSSFAYNESTAHQYFPLTKEQALKEDFQWKEEDTKTYREQTYKIPDFILGITNEICDQILACEKCYRNFKIIPQEFDFYKKQNIPIPRWCSECRNRLRLDLRNPKKLWSRNCEKCQTLIQTTYAPDYSGKVYCENCYLKEIY